MVKGKKVPFLNPPSSLSDFYMPSDDPKDREIAFIVLGTVVMGLIA